MMAPQAKPKQNVAIVGSGMAGLVTAHLLHRDAHERYSVTVFEREKSFSLDSGSVSVIDATQAMVDRIDVPMRAFAEGYYPNLIRMYKYLGVLYHPQQFTYSFERVTPSKNNQGCYFIHSSNNHQLPPIRPEGMNMISWIIEVLYVAFCYLWWSICCFLIQPKQSTSIRESESAEEYIRRIMLPSHFVNFYLLPLLSSVATCSHKDLLGSPAKDLTDYKRKSAGGDHYTVSGVHEVQHVLGKALNARLSTLVTKIEVLGEGGNKVVWTTLDDQQIHQEVFDHVILAVAPNVVGKIFYPLESTVKKIPTTIVESIVQGDGFDISTEFNSASKYSTMNRKAAQLIHFRTSISLGKTESIHVHPSGATVTTCPFSETLSTQHSLRSVKLLRALRTPLSRRVVNDLFGENESHPRFDEKKLSWRNGDGNVWLVGGWCWDGMVLLEGCIVSAIRVALALDVDIPWRDLST